MTDRHAPAPVPTHRLIPSRFPPIGLFDTVATAADMEAVMDLAGWTNDRLAVERINRLPCEEWVYGRPNASIIMAAFLHVAPCGMRFNNADLGAWYAADGLATAVAEVAHHLRRETVARGLRHARRCYREYQAVLEGAYLDIRGEQASRAALYDPASYAASQVFGESVRASGAPGILYDSVRHAGGQAVVGFRPHLIAGVTQAGHFELTVQVATPRIEVRTLHA